MHSQAYGQSPMNAEGYANYGAMPGFEQQHPSFGTYRKPGRTPWETMLTTASLLVPSIIFTGVMAVNTFGIYYQNASASSAISWLLLALVAAFGYSAFVTVRRPSQGNEASWSVVLFVASLVAWILGYVLGQANFNSNMKPYFDIQQLNVYSTVDPAKYKGTQLMDAGRITFTPGSHLDTARSMGFRNLDTYCVAPIVSGSGENVSSYDFWAVGMNCCSGHTPDFHCGEYNNPRALSGLRLMQDGERAFFRLAVDQAEAAYGLKARHPLFMYWMQDPIAEVNAYQDDGYKFFLAGLFGHLAGQLLFLVPASFFIISKVVI